VSVSIFVQSAFPIMISMEDCAGSEGVGAPVDLEDCRYLKSLQSVISCDLDTVRVRAEEICSRLD